MEMYRKISEIKSEMTKQERIINNQDKRMNVNSEIKNKSTPVHVKVNEIQASEVSVINEDDIDYYIDYEIDNYKETERDGDFEERLDALEERPKYSFVIIIVIALVTWMIVRLWYDALQIFLYKTLKLDKDSLGVVLGVAVFITFIFVAIIAFFDLGDFVK